jgi:membrane-bound serine protease (ClpP class)
MWWIILLFVVGVALILAEFFLPGLICGVLGCLLVVSSCAVAVYTHPDNALMIIMLEIVGTVAAVIVGVVVFPRTRAARYMILETSQQVQEGWVDTPTDHSLLGARGEVFTPLRPAGSVVIGNRRINAVSDGTFIDKGSSVRVIEVQGNRVVVEQAEPA